MMGTAQQITTLQGYLGVEGGESFKFQLEFVDSAGTISGHSYTWLYENSEVKTAITGTIDRQRQTLSFRETSIIHNKGFKSNVTICLINATLRFEATDQGRVFRGPITSSDISNVSCGKGTITFMDSEVLRQLFSAVPNIVATPETTATPQKPKKPVRVVYDTARRSTRMSVVAQKDTVEKITEGKGKRYQWASDTVELEIWDGSRIDGDVVTVFLNERAVLSDYQLTANRRLLRLPLRKGENTLSIRAGHEGSEPPNTADILLRDGKTVYRLVAYNRVGKEAVLVISR